jgi:hypothetical protein
VFAFSLNDIVSYFKNLFKNPLEDITNHPANTTTTAPSTTTTIMSNSNVVVTSEKCKYYAEKYGKKLSEFEDVIQKANNRAALENHIKENYNDFVAELSSLCGMTQDKTVTYLADIVIQNYKPITGSFLDELKSFFSSLFTHSK